MTNNNSDSSKKLRQLLLSLTAIISVSVFLIWSGYRIFSNYREITKKDKYAQLEQILSEDKLMFQDWIESNQKKIASFSSDDRIITLDPESLGSVLDVLLKGNPEFENLQILGPDGKSIASTSGKTLDYSSRDFFKQSISGEPAIAGPFLSLNTGKVLLGFSHQIHNSDSIVGVFYALIPLDNLSTNLAKTAPGATGEVYLIDSSGVLITPSRFEDDLKKRMMIIERSSMELHIDSFAAYQLQEGKNGTSEYMNYLGNPVLGTYTKLSDPDWGLIVEQSSREANKKTGLATVIFLLSVILISVISIILICISIIRYKNASELD